MANGVAYVGSDDFNVYALNASTGAKLWSYATGSNVSSSPAVANGVVYVGSGDHNVYAFGLSGCGRGTGLITQGQAFKSIRWPPMNAINADKTRPESATLRDA